MKLTYGYCAFLLSFSTITAKTNTTLVSKCKLKLVSDEDMKKDYNVLLGMQGIENIFENLARPEPGFKAVVTLPDLQFCLEPQDIVDQGTTYDFSWTETVYTIKCENRKVCDPKDDTTQTSSTNCTAKYYVNIFVPIPPAVTELNCK